MKGQKELLLFQGMKNKRIKEVEEEFQHRSIDGEVPRH
jgi:hypothetical protein